MVVRPVGVVQPLPLVVVRTGHTAVRQGEPCPDLWSIESGVFAARMVNAEGRSFLIDLYGPGDPIGTPGEQPAHVTATALRPARLRPLRGDDAVAALVALTARLAAFAADLAWFGVAERIERRLVDLACRIGQPTDGGTLIPIRLTQDDLASMVGATRETTNRALQTLFARGVLDRQGRGRYVVRSQLRLVTEAPRLGRAGGLAL
jgi:CRP/FNR family transcriptional regulator, cyclic AMP receptor protein